MKSPTIYLIIILAVIIMATAVQTKKGTKRVKISKASGTNHQQTSINEDDVSTCNMINGIQVCSPSSRKQTSSSFGLLNIGGMIIGTALLGFVISKLLSNKNQKSLTSQFEKEYSKNPSTMTEDEKQSIISRLSQGNFNIKATTSNQSNQFSIAIQKVQMKKQHNSLHKLVVRAMENQKSCSMVGSLIFYKKKFGIMLIRAYGKEEGKGSVERSCIFKGFGHKVSKVNGDWYRLGASQSQQNSGTWTVG